VPRIENLIHRAHYAIQATRRVTKETLGGKTVQQAIRSEAKNFALHLQANSRRDAAEQADKAAQELFGPIGGWYHGDPKEPRPSHLAAHGKNVVLGTVPISTGAKAGALPGCTCHYGPPFENAEVLR